MTDQRLLVSGPLTRGSGRPFPPVPLPALPSGCSFIGDTGQCGRRLFLPHSPLLPRSPLLPGCRRTELRKGLPGGSVIGSHPLPSVPQACLCSVRSGGTERGAALAVGSPMGGCSSSSCVALSGARAPLTSQRSFWSSSYSCLAPRERPRQPAAPPDRFDLRGCSSRAFPAAWSFYCLGLPGGASLGQSPCSPGAALTALEPHVSA